LDADAMADGAVPRRHRGIRGSVSPSASSDEDEGEDDEEDDGVLARFHGDVEDEDAEQIDPTRRIALVDMNWDHVRAVDVFVLLSSFLPKKGRIESVSVRQTELGMKRLPQEAVLGPVAAFRSRRDLDSDGEGVGVGVGGGGGNSDDDDDEGTEVDPERLREYERERLGYYFALVQCDSKETSDAIFRECDGVEYERSANRISLRYIPDDMDLSARPERDRADCIPVDYAPPVLKANALQNTKAKLTWDAEPLDRKRALRSVMTEERLAKDDLNAYLASSSEEEEDPESKAELERKRALLLGNLRKADKKTAAAAAVAGDDEEDDAVFGRTGQKNLGREGDMVVEFKTGALEDVVGRRKKRLAEAEETVFEAQQRKRREAKAQRRAERKSAAENGGEAEEPQDDLGFNDPFFADGGGSAHPPPPSEDELSGSDSAGAKGGHGKKKRRKKAGASAAAEADADLELLMMSDDRLRAGLPAKTKTAVADGGGAAEGKKGLRAKRRQKMEAKAATKAAKAAKLAPVDASDARFDALFESADFALDPTHPQFKALNRADDIIQERNRRRTQKKEKRAEPAATAKAAAHGKTASALPVNLNNLKRKLASNAVQ